MNGVFGILALEDAHGGGGGEEGRRRALLASKRTDEMGVEKVEVRDRNRG